MVAHAALAHRCVCPATVLHCLLCLHLHLLANSQHSHMRTSVCIAASCPTQRCHSACSHHACIRCARWHSRHFRPRTPHCRWWQCKPQAASECTLKDELAICSVASNVWRKPSGGDGPPAAGRAGAGGECWHAAHRGPLCRRPRWTTTTKRTANHRCYRSSAPRCVPRPGQAKLRATCLGPLGLAWQVAAATTATASTPAAAVPRQPAAKRDGASAR